MVVTPNSTEPPNLLNCILDTRNATEHYRYVPTMQHIQVQHSPKSPNHQKTTTRPARRVRCVCAECVVIFSNSARTNLITRSVSVVGLNFGVLSDLWLCKLKNFIAKASNFKFLALASIT